jgi:hypothetical protein
MPKLLANVARTHLMLLAALPIIVELFTSEGCSSCPPADAVLAKLHEAQPVPGVQLLVLSEHVDYWNNLGWKDPYSSGLFTDRQARHGPRIYTPQAIVDGRIDVLGSDQKGIEQAAKAASLSPHGTLTARRDGDKLHIEVANLPQHGPAQLIVATVEDGLVDKVEKGENAGRTLSHTAVVRRLSPLASIGANEMYKTVEAPLETQPRTRLVIFVEERDSARVLAAGTL